MKPAGCRLFAANGTTIIVIGEKILNVHVGDLTILTRFVVSDNVTELMLGVNWLRPNRIIWDFSKDVLLVNGRKFSLISRRSKSMCRRIVSMENTFIPPRSQRILPGRIEMNRMSHGEAEHVWTTEVNELKNGVKVARAIMPHRLDKVPVLVLNDSIVSKKIDAGTVLSKLTIAECMNKGGAVEGDVSYTGCYEHLSKLTEGIDGSVTEEQKIRLVEILKRYSDVFSKKELDLGETSLAKHRIDTGDARPMRQTLRRQPFHLLNKIDGHVQDMLKAGVIEPSRSP